MAQHAKLKLMQSIGAFSSIFLIKAILKKIDVAKQLLVIELEQGLEVFIPRELQQHDLPSSFRYFDCILQLIQDSISRERKQFFLLNLQFNLNQMRERDHLELTKQKCIGLEEKLFVKQ